MLESPRRRFAPLSLLEPSSMAAPGQNASLYPTLVDALPDPILVVTGSDRADLSGRRFILANAAARDLLRISVDEGLLLSAVRDPEVLAAVDRALFEGADA